MSKCKSVWAIAVVAGPMAFGTWAFGGIAVLDQQRLIHIFGRYDGSDPSGPPSGVLFDQTLIADPFAPFDQSLSNSKLVRGYGSTASARQNSSLTADSMSMHLTASGEVIADASDNAIGQAENLYRVVFAVDTPTSYLLTEQTTVSPVQFDITNDGAMLQHGQAPVSLRQFPSDSLIPPVRKIDPPYSPGAGPFTYTGTLSPGTYTFQGGTFSDVETAGADGSFQVDFVLTSSPTAVPLPPAVWPGLAVLGVLCGALGVRRRLARSHR